ncbi:apolipoprotein N-acyltransferase [Vibrio hepatarius]|uniref:apolipoprotein N-acyltransferase n=1 Tax=Vibrio hepatarius TaxID=171383 RepID=UPI003736EAF3
MWWLGIVAGVAHAMSYRFELISLGIALISFAVLFFVHVQLKTKGARFALWMLFGLGYYVTSLFWVNGYLADEYGDASWIRWGLWPLLIFILSLSFLIVPLLILTLSRSSTLVALPFVLVSIDIVRELTSFSFSWLHPGFLFLDAGLSGWLSVIGAFGGSFFVYVVASLLVYLLINRTPPLRSLSLLAVSILTIVAFDKGIEAVNNFYLTSEQAKVRLIHGNFSGTHKLSKNEVIERVQRYASLSLQAPRADIVVWPESSMSMPYREIAPFVQDSLQKLDDKHVAAVWGGQARNGQHLQNVIYRNDELAPIYYKQRLVPFGEYRPAWFIDWMERVTLSRGGDIQVVPNTSNVHNIGPLKAVLAVCYEALYSDVFASKLQSGNVAILLSDVEWTQTPWVKQFLLKLTQVRAAEVGKSIIYPTNQGFTSLIAPNGDVLSQVTNQRTQVLDVVVPLQARQTLYTQYGHQWLLWLSVGVLLSLHALNQIGKTNVRSTNNKRLFSAK